jgi:hypothetical protein
MVLIHNVQGKSDRKNRRKLREGIELWTVGDAHLGNGDEGLKTFAKSCS